MMVTGTVGPIGKQEWYCFLDGRSNSKKSYFSLCFEVHIFHKMCHLALFYVQWSESVTAVGLFKFGNKFGGIYCILLSECFLE